MDEIKEIDRVVSAKDPVEVRNNILKLEACMQAMPEHQIEIKTTHHICNGVYAREIFIPKGVTLTGKIHKTEHLNIISAGEITVWTDEGMKRIKAPCTLISKPGMKRVGYAHEDTVWTTIHGTQETDLVKLEADLIAKDFSEIEEMMKPQIERKA